MNTNQTKMAADAAAPWSNASGTIGAAPAIEQSKWKSPNDISQQYDQSVGQGNATQHQWAYGDNDHQYRETQRIQNPGSETFNDKIGKPSEEPNIIQQETKSGDSENPFTGVTGDNHGQRNEEAIQQGLHQNVTIRQHRCHALPTPRQLIREASREASTLVRDDNDRPADDTHPQNTAGKENEEAPTREHDADQYDPTGQYFQHPKGSFQQQHDSDMHAAWGNSRPEDTGPDTGQQMEKIHLELPLHNPAKENKSGHWADGTWHEAVPTPTQGPPPGEVGPTRQEWQAVATLQAENDARWNEQARMAHQLLRDWEAMPDQEAQVHVPGAGEQKQATTFISPLQWKHEKEQGAQETTGQPQYVEQLKAATTGWINWDHNNVPGAGEQESMHIHPQQWRQQVQPWAQGPAGQHQGSPQMQVKLGPIGWGLAGTGQRRVSTDHEHATPSADGKQAHGQGFNPVAVSGHQPVPGTAGNVALASTPSTNPFEDYPANLHHTITGEHRCSPTAFRDATSEDPSQPRHRHLDAEQREKFYTERAQWYAGRASPHYAVKPTKYTFTEQPFGGLHAQHNMGGGQTGHRNTQHVEANRTDGGQQFQQFHEMTTEQQILWEQFKREQAPRPVDTDPTGRSHRAP